MKKYFRLSLLAIAMTTFASANVNYQAQMKAEKQKKHEKECADLKDQKIEAVIERRLSDVEKLRKVMEIKCPDPRANETKEEWEARMKAEGDKNEKELREKGEIND